MFRTVGPESEVLLLSVFYLWAGRGAEPDLIGTGQLEFKAEELLDGSHGDSAGAADEPLHQILTTHTHRHTHRTVSERCCRRCCLGRAGFVMSNAR